jgi:hypothetical protein
MSHTYRTFRLCTIHVTDSVINNPRTTDTHKLLFIRPFTRYDRTFPWLGIGCFFYTKCTKQSTEKLRAIYTYSNCYVFKGTRIWCWHRCCRWLNSLPLLRKFCTNSRSLSTGQMYFPLTPGLRLTQKPLYSGFNIAAQNIAVAVLYSLRCFNFDFGVP